MKNFRPLIDHLLSAPDEQIDASLKPKIKTWPDKPTAIQVLEVLDLCIHGGLASSLVVYSLQVIYDDLCREENTTHEEIVKNAIWRNN